MSSQRRFIRLFQLVFIGSGLVLLFTDPVLFPSYYKPIPMGVISFFHAFLIQLPVFVFRVPVGTSEEQARKIKFSREQFQSALAIGLLLSGLGSLGLWGLYQKGIPYDKFIHFLFPALMMVSASYLFRVLYGWSLKKAAWRVALIVMVSGVAWEYIEFIAARYFELGFFGKLFDRNSVLDILSNILGILAGSVIIGWRQWMGKRLI